MKLIKIIYVDKYLIVYVNLITKFKNRKLLIFVNFKITENVQSVLTTQVLDCQTKNL